ncbi:MAG: SGNH/GDSL hydrolase family protein [Candidatus Thorarchaeota archaeon]
MLILFLAFNGLILLVLAILIGGTYYQSERLPKNTPSNYLKRQTLIKENTGIAVLIGDSITHGRIGMNYVEMVERNFNEGQFEFINAGINSELAWNCLQRVDEVIQCKPDIVTVLVGTNDANASMSEKQMKDYIKRMKLPRPPDIDWYRESLRSLVIKIRTETNARIALLSIPTIGEDSSHPAFQRSSDFGRIVNEVAEETGVTYLPLHEKMVEYLQDGSAEPSYPYEKYLIGIIKGIMYHYLLRKSWDEIASSSGFSLHVDYLHLNTAGAQIVADMITEFIQSTLTRT